MVASPPETHLEYAAKTIRAGKPLFVEKPLCLETAAAEWLLTVADSQVHVGHILIHAEGFQKQVAEQPLRFEAWRASNNPGYHGVNAWWDIGVHDVAAAVHLYGRPTEVAGTVTAETYDVRLKFPRGEAHLEGSRVHEAKQWILHFDGTKYTPYGENTEPLQVEIEAFLDGYDNLAEAVTVIETLGRA
jgi:UDP-2-acetamido-3-amino-2,3-dideoxy-glucuronate N-acetyltransferase